MLGLELVQAKYFVDEVKDKNGKTIDISSWDMEYVKDLPLQQNGYKILVLLILLEKPPLAMRVYILI